MRVWKKKAPYPSAYRISPRRSASSFVGWASRRCRRARASWGRTSGPGKGGGSRHLCGVFFDALVKEAKRGQVLLILMEGRELRPERSVSLFLHAEKGVFRGGEKELQETHAMADCGEGVVRLPVVEEVVVVVLRSSRRCAAS